MGESRLAAHRGDWEKLDLQRTVKSGLATHRSDWEKLDLQRSTVIELYVRSAQGQLGEARLAARRSDWEKFDL